MHGAVVGVLEVYSKYMYTTAAVYNMWKVLKQALPEIGSRGYLCVLY